MTLHFSVSVVIPVLNGGETLAQTLSSLRSQARLPKEFEIIVVDNGSTDNTLEVAQSYDVKIFNEAKKGPAAARNCGLHKAEGDIIVHVDADTVPSRRWLSSLIALFEDPSVIIAGGRVIGYPPVTGAERFMSSHGIWEPENNIFRPLFPFVPSLNLAVRKQAALDIGGWCDSMLTGEDVDFTHRLLKKYPSEIGYSDKAILFHHHRKTDDQLRKQAWTYGEGGAEMYRRFPDEANFGLRKMMYVAKVMLSRGIYPSLLSVKAFFGQSDAKQIEFYKYHRLWTWWWWRGFFNMYFKEERKVWSDSI